MPNNEDYNLFVDNLISTAYANFRKTEQSKVIQEKLDRMDKDCEMMLGVPEREFIDECFCLHNEISCEREAYLYRQGIKDCVWLLKNMGVLA